MRHEEQKCRNVWRKKRQRAQKVDEFGRDRGGGRRRKGVRRPGGHRGWS